MLNNLVLPQLELGKYKLEEQLDKVKEELEEVYTAHSKEERVSELLDLLQATLGALDIASKELESKFALDKLNLNHVQKLIDRGWSFKALLNIERVEEE